MSTPGLDAIFVGPSDLSVSMSHSPGLGPKFPKIYDAIKKIAETAKKYNVVPGIHTGSVEYTREMEALGYQFFAFPSEFRFVAMAGNAYLKDLADDRSRTGNPVEILLKPSFVTEALRLLLARALRRGA